MSKQIAVKEKKILLKKYFNLPERTRAHSSILSKIERDLRKRKYKIKDEYTIPYDSPTGRVYIGVAKRPLQPAKADGYGFQGVLLQTDNREFIQCHVCGKWMKKISGQHLESHGLDKRKYQNKFGLYKGNSLVCDATSYRCEIAGMKRVEKHPEANIKTLAKGRIGAAKKNKIRSHKIADRIEHQNRYAICERQLGFRLIEYIRQFHQLPSRSSKSDGRKIAKALFRRYGSLNDGYKHYGLPAQYRDGTNVELVAPDNKQMFFNYNKKSYNRDHVYEWMKEHCPNLANESINVFADYLQPNK